MFKTKTTRIKAYLQTLSEKSPFDELLSDCMEERLQARFSALGATKIDIHIDWTDNIKCIGIQAKYQKYCLDIQVYPDEYSFSADLDEPDNDTSAELSSASNFYNDIKERCKSMKEKKHERDQY